MKNKGFDNISVVLPKREIFSRLGFVDRKTKVTLSQKKKIDEYIEQARAIIQLKGVSARLNILKNSNGIISLADNIKFKSKSLSKLLAGSDEVIFLGVSAGKNIVKAITANSQGKDVTAAVVFDAVASEMTDAALDWIVSYYNQELLRESKCLIKKRFSCGYGDFTLDNQKIIFEVLKMKKLGVSLTKTFLLIPEKSVTAILGIRKIKIK